MKLDLFEEIIDEVAFKGPIFRLFLVKDGEPLLHKNIVDIVRYAKKKKVARLISIISNGIELNKDLAEALLDSGLTDITFSVDTLDPEHYAKMKGKDKLEKVVDNIHRLYTMKNRRKLKYPYIRVKAIAGSEQFNKAFKKHWHRWADYVDITRQHYWADELEGKDKLKKRRYPCPLIWHTGVINYDGTFDICCVDGLRKSILGDVKNQSIEEIWNGPKLSEIRKNHYDGNYGSIPLCRSCDYWQLKENIYFALKVKKIINKNIMNYPQKERL